MTSAAVAPRGAPAAAAGPAFTVSVIIPTRDRRDDLRNCLQALARSCLTGVVEVILVDDCSREPVRADVPLPPEVAVRIIRNDAPLGSAVSRNLAAETAVGDALAFLDDDARIPGHWFRTVQRELSPQRGAITGPVYGFDEDVVARARQRRYDQRYRGLATGDAINFLAGGNSVVWADAFRRAGAFPVLATASDNAFLRRLQGTGLGCYFVRDLFIDHRNSKGLRSAVVCAFQAGAASGALPAAPPARRRAPAPDDPPRDLAVEALNSFLNLCFRMGRLAARRPVPPAMRGSILKDGAG